MFDEITRILTALNHSSDVISYFVKYDEEKKEKQILITFKDPENVNVR